MQRKTFLAATLALVLGAGVGLYAMGTANAAEWHAYAGNVFAGHAYGVQVPEHARTLELSYHGNGSAAAMLLAPDGARVGYYALDAKVGSALVDQPHAGEYALYVYDVQGGALSLRVASDATPRTDLAKLDLARKDVQLASSDAPDALDVATDLTLKDAPVFVTLLYEGSAEGLDATIASEQGNVLTIAHEDGTAFSPGVFSSQTGTRSADFAHVGGTTYTVDAKATRFEGTLFLTALSVARPSPHPQAPLAPLPLVPSEAPREQHKEAAPTPPAKPGAPTVVRLGQDRAFAFDALAGTLTFSDPKASDAKRAASGIDATVLLYTPDDVLLRAVHLNGTAPTVTVELPVDGEYVAYVANAHNLAVYAAIPGGDGTVRELPLSKLTQSVDITSDAWGGSAKVTLPHAPVDIAIDGADAIAVFGSAELRNEKGVAAYWSDLASARSPEMLGEGTSQDYANFAEGEHVLETYGITAGKLRITETFYERDSSAPASEDAPAAPAQPAQPLPVSAPALPQVIGLPRL